ncbi:hypothetical protein JCM8547_005169 [Rhodosporidiobolus lusitaniae]
MRSASVSVLFAALLAAPGALASLATLRATIPGSLHQCEATNIFLFDSSNERPVTIVFLPQAVAPSGTTTLDAALALGAYQVIQDITTPDAQQTNFVLAIAEGESFATLGFLPDGTGKNLNLDRSVQASLPGATACNPATAAVAAAAAGGSSSSEDATTTTATTAVAAVSTTTTPLPSSIATSLRSSVSSAASSASSAISSAADSASSSAAAAASASATGAASVAQVVAGSVVGVVAAVAAAFLA